jgi:DNA-binding NtrC family response regulator
VRLGGAAVPALAAAAAPAPAPAGTLRDDNRALERQRIVDALEKCAGNQTEAARLLGIPRRTLTTRLTQYGLARPRKAR